MTAVDGLSGSGWRVLLTESLDRGDYARAAAEPRSAAVNLSPTAKLRRSGLRRIAVKLDYTSAHRSLRLALRHARSRR